MRYPNDSLKGITRRHFFRQTGFGISAAALTTLLNESLFGALNGDPLAVKPPPFAARAKHIIYLFMAGAPSQLDLFDYKPKLIEYSGQLCPEELIKNERFAFIKGRPKLLGSPRKFWEHGESGQVISELLPHTAKIADDLCVVRSMKTEEFNHAPAQIYMNTGFRLMGRPAMGSWLTYGIGSANRDLPGFVVLVSGDKHPDGGKSCWSAGFLPTQYQGVDFRNIKASPKRNAPGCTCR